MATGLFLCAELIRQEAEVELVPRFSAGLVLLREGGVMWGVGRALEPKPLPQREAGVLQVKKKIVDQSSKVSPPGLKPRKLLL